ncbi:3-hydroxyisobutyrate dehydrogenase [Neohortaea acidophila]|uniref:3-hydroxyisobutyrate dehydrogenase n=1 Tax=Neohortaea acidophila TaxID=245834 RepID=A0A6A6Q4I8_9PEZI|nr:3-hydroxyisobutyrate dehydrogenase [Neohortaea acidophila]KAF2486939.1 3-hydroxyisobutyrate dehydrogenase [Neohortaea acidophila]
MSTNSVVVIGLGAMGGAIAVRLKEQGVDVTGYDINPEARERFRAASGKVAADVEVVRTADTVITSLPNDDNLCASLKEGGVIERLQPHQTFIEMSTTLPQTMVDVAESLRSKVRGVVDAPVSGGPNEAKAGKLSILVGVEGKDGDGEGDLAPATRELLSNLGTVHIIGRPGNGKALKLVNNAISLSNTALAMETFQLGTALGLDRETMFKVISTSGGSSTMFKKRIPYVLDNDYSARFSVSLAEKDTRLALQTAGKLHFPTPLLANVHQRYEAAMAQGLGNEDIVALIKLYVRE